MMNRRRLATINQRAPNAGFACRLATLLKATHARCPRAGFTIIEAVIALVLLSIGALGLASTSAWAARLNADARAIDAQTRNVQDTIDSLRALPCLAIASGSAVRASGIVAWSVTHTSSVAEVALLAPAPARRAANLPVQLIIPCE
ncbi:MAG: type II secretion system protein [Gemmatimonadaceae bacterium]